MLDVFSFPAAVSVCCPLVEPSSAPPPIVLLLFEEPMEDILWEGGIEKEDRLRLAKGATREEIFRVLVLVVTSFVGFSLSLYSYAAEVRDPNPERMPFLY